jgi:hypothetical protein
MGSGCQSGSSPAIRSLVPEPLALIVKTWKGPLRFDAKAIFVPSGDQDGVMSDPGALVS